MEKCYEIAENLLETLGIDEMISYVCSLTDEDILNIINS